MKNDNGVPAEFADAAVVSREAGCNMLTRLDLVALKPKRILDAGCRVGFCTQLLSTRYPAASIIAIDHTEAMLKYARQTAIPANWVCAEADRMPFAAQSFDLIVANLLIPWCADIKKLLRQWRQLLRPDGLLMFTSLGPDTLKELRQYAIPLPQWMDMHDLGDELVQAGFADPVLDIEHFTLKYRAQEQLLHELHVTGMLDPVAIAALSDSLLGTLASSNESHLSDGPHPDSAVNAALIPLQECHPLITEKPNATRASNDMSADMTSPPTSRLNSRGFPLCLTYEVIYGHAWGPKPASEFTADDEGIVRIPLSHLRGRT